MPKPLPAICSMRLSLPLSDNPFAPKPDITGPGAPMRVLGNKGGGEEGNVAHRVACAVSPSASPEG